MKGCCFMIYITAMQSPIHYQMTLEELLFGQKNSRPQVVNPNMTNTRTFKVENVSQKILDKVDIEKLVSRLTQFNKTCEDLRNHHPRQGLYHTFSIPKKSGGLRRIDAPNEELMNALRQLKTMLENDFGALYHTSAFAYIKKRSTLHAVKKHQSNESKWFGKYDLSNFFGSTTLSFVMSMLSMVFPFSEVIKHDIGKVELEKALELGFLNGVLPQGTPLSPILTNIMMIPIDYKLANEFRDFNKQRFIYTRYADDFMISSKYTFNFKEVEKYIVDVLAEFAAPFTINSTKTRYGSSSGSNWNLGVMLNKDNEITVGHKKKKHFQAMLSSYIMDKQNGKVWDKSDVQIMEGYRNYYRMVEKDTIDKIVKHIGDKFGVNVVELIKCDLKT